MDRVMARQTDDVFEEEFLASLYDYFNTWDACDEFYLELAREAGGRVLDLGCGTGMLACRIAEEGLSVTGADPAEGMLRVARSRQGTERVCWIKADGQTLRLPLRFDLIYMTGHAFQALLTDDDAIAVLRTAHEHLTGDGRFAFESRNPARRAWLSWTPNRRKVVTTNDHGRIEEFVDTVVDPQTGVVDIAHHYGFLDTGKSIVGRSRIRFIDQDHLTRLLAAANLIPITWYGDWDRTPLTPASSEFIVVTCRADRRPLQNCAQLHDVTNPFESVTGLYPAAPHRAGWRNDGSERT
jgi:SAM-dependent methyltransferase